MSTAVIFAFAPRAFGAAVAAAEVTERGRRLPDFLRCNTIRSIRRQMSAHGFRAAVYGHTSEPLYLTFSRLAYALGVLHQRFAPRAWGLTIFAFGQLVA